MSTEKPEAPAPSSAPAPAAAVLSPEAEAAKKEKALVAALAKLPSVEELEAEIKSLEAKKSELAKLQDVKLNFGPGKPGKKKFNLPALPKGLGHVTVNGKKWEGLIELTHEEYTNWKSIYDLRVEHERKGRTGLVLEDRELFAFGAGSGVGIAVTGATAKF